jgi:hypothetical protein
LEEEFFGCSSIGRQKTSSEPEKTRKKPGIEVQAEDFDQKSAAGNRK